MIDFVALTGERISFIMSQVLARDFFQVSLERQSERMGEKDGDIVIKICDKTMRLLLRLETVDGGFIACTEFRDLHDVAAQEARHKAR